MHKDSLAGRLLGILVFLVGIAILVVVAVLAYNLFSASTSAVQLKPGGDGAAASLGASVVRFIYQILLLIVLCVAGSLVAARGLHLYFVASGPASTTGSDSTEGKPKV
ncbi:MAG: hypothetical protein ACOX3G_07245 [Armatimonadota bacterium]|jgi:hypothetical protein